MYNILFLGMFQDVMSGPGKGSCTDHTLEILGMLLGAFILGYLLRYFIGAKWRNKVGELEGQVNTLTRESDNWRTKSNEYEADLSTARYEKDKLDVKYAEIKHENAGMDIQLKAFDEQISGYKKQIADLEAGNKTASTDKVTTPLMATATSMMGAKLAGKFKTDDLKIIEGIGPKIAGLLEAGGINTWEKLANADIDAIKKILTDAGDRYSLANPGTWSKQARMAADGKWDELQTYQDYLDGGKEP